MSKHSAIQQLEQKQIKSNVTDFSVGDTVCVKIRIIEASKDGKEAPKERLQTFQGTVIAKTGSGVSETFSVHRIAYGEGMERVFFLHSPLVASIEVVRRGQVRRSKLYYLRGTSGKASKVKGRFGSAAQAKAFAENDAPEAAVAVENEADVSA